VNLLRIEDGDMTNLLLTDSRGIRYLYKVVCSTAPWGLRLWGHGAQALF
jgi:hypothetical protein